MVHSFFFQFLLKRFNYVILILKDDKKDTGTGMGLFEMRIESSHVTVFEAEVLQKRKFWLLEVYRVAAKRKKDTKASKREEEDFPINVETRKKSHYYLLIWQIRKKL